MVLEVIPRPAASGGNVFETQILEPTRDLENKNLGWNPAICVLRIPPGDSDTSGILKTFVLGQSWGALKHIPPVPAKIFIPAFLFLKLLS